MPLTAKQATVRFLVNTYLDGDPKQAADHTDFTSQQVRSWVEGSATPQQKNVERLIESVFAPFFEYIVEYEPIEVSGAETRVRGQLKEMLTGYEHASGLYAFYDSMASLIYIGKSDGNLLAECYQQLNATIRDDIFPSGASQPTKRLDVVRYVSACCVRTSHAVDYAKHVESLILRISKPRLNKNIGRIEKASD